MAKTPMTTRGAELLRAELHRLKTVDRPNVITAIAEAARNLACSGAIPLAVTDNLNFGNQHNPQNYLQLVE